MKTFLLLLLTFLILPAVQSCQDKDDPEYECTSDITVLLPEKAVSMFFFKEGSYWIYQREDSLYTDSVWVTGVKSSAYQVNHKEYPDITDKKCYETKSTFLTSENGYFFSSSDFTLQNRFPKNTSSYSEELFVLYEAPILNTGRSDQIRLNLKGNTFSKINAYGDSLFLIDSMVVYSRIYRDIVVLNKQASTFPDYLKDVCYAPHFGMIRFVDKHDSRWNLVRYNIVQ